MKVKQALAWGAEQLYGLNQPRLEAEVLLMHATGWDRVRLYQNVDQRLSLVTNWRFRRMVAKRAAHTPAAYLTNVKEFCGLEFRVTPNVLIPRPETESLVKRASVIVAEKQINQVYEVGTGSGNIAITLAVLHPTLTITASDISRSALKVAHDNARRHLVTPRIRLVQTNLAEHIDQAELIVANLPYIPQQFEVMDEILHEPAVAIFGGDDGLNLYREMFSQPAFAHLTGICLIELGARQYDTMRDWLHHRYPHIAITPIKSIDGAVCGLEADFSPALAE